MLEIESRGRHGAARRLLDTASGIAFGILVVLGVQAWHAAASVAPREATPTAAWVNGPWAGCTLAYMSQYDSTAIPGTIAHQVNGTWTCSQAIPPAYFTPVARPTPSQNR